MYDNIREGFTGKNHNCFEQMPSSSSVASMVTYNDENIINNVDDDDNE